MDNQLTKQFGNENANQRLPNYTEVLVKGATLLNNGQHSSQFSSLETKCWFAVTLCEKPWHRTPWPVEVQLVNLSKISFYHLISTCFVQCNWCYTSTKEKLLTTQMASSSQVPPQRNSNGVLRILACVVVENEDTKTMLKTILSTLP